MKIPTVHVNATPGKICQMLRKSDISVQYEINFQ